MKSYKQQAERDLLAGRGRGAESLEGIRVRPHPEKRTHDVKILKI